MSITVLLYSETIYGRYMCSNLWSHVPNTDVFSYAILWRVYVYIVYAIRVFIAILLFDVVLFLHAFHIYWKSGREGFRGTRIYCPIRMSPYIFLLYKILHLCFRCIDFYNLSAWDCSWFVVYIRKFI